MSSPHFLTELEAYLHSPSLTAPWAREMLVNALERVEAGASSHKRPRPDQWLAHWQKHDRIVQLVFRMDSALRSSFAHEATAAERQHLIAIGLALVPDCRRCALYREPAG